MYYESGGAARRESEYNQAPLPSQATTALTQVAAKAFQLVLLLYPDPASQCLVSALQPESSTALLSLVLQGVPISFRVKAGQSYSGPRGPEGSVRHHLSDFISHYSLPSLTELQPHWPPCWSLKMPCTCPGCILHGLLRPWISHTAFHHLKIFVAASPDPQEGLYTGSGRSNTCLSVVGRVIIWV